MSEVDLLQKMHARNAREFLENAAAETALICYHFPQLTPADVDAMSPLEVKRYTNTIEYVTAQQDVVNLMNLAAVQDKKLYAKVAGYLQKRIDTAKKGLA